MIQSLQSQLQHATPQQKSGIIAQIKNIGEVQIPAAQANVDKANAALKRCRLLSTVGPIATHPHRDSIERPFHRGGRA